MLEQHRLQKFLCGLSAWDWIVLIVPLAGWLPRYKWRSRLLADIVAGLTIGVMVVPQAISYANLAGLPSRYGLHAAFIPVLAYAMYGSSRQLAVGPVAITSLILSNGLIDIVPGSEDNDDPNMPFNPEAQINYNTAAIQVSVLAGMMYLCGGFCRLGFLSNFLSHSVISGFTTGSAIIIGVSQLKFFLGISMHRHWHVFTSVYRLAVRISHGEADWREAAMGAAWLTILLTMKHIGKTSKKWKWTRPLGPLTVTFLAISLVWWLDLQAAGIKVVGRVKAGLPDISVDRWLPISNLPDMATIAALVTIVGLMESIAVAKSLADKNQYEINTNQELAGLGLANLAGAAFSSYPVAGSFSRSAVANDSGAKSGLAGVLSAVLVGVVMTFLMPLVRYMPLNALAAIITSGVIGLFDYGEGIYLFKVNKLDWLVWMTSAISTVVLGVQVGLAISIGLALLLVIYESAFPRICVLGCLPQTTIYRNIEQYPSAITEDSLVVLRVDAPIYFANVQHIKDYIKEQYCQADCDKFPLPVRASAVRYIILDCSSVTHLDAAGVRGLASLRTILKKCSIGFCLCNPAQNVVTIMDRAGLTDELGRQHIFVEVQDAVDFCREALLAESVGARNGVPWPVANGEPLRRAMSTPIQQADR